MFNRHLRTGRVLEEVAAERQRQDERWGVQHHMIVGSEGERRDHRDAADFFKSVVRPPGCPVTWREILLEEVHETLAESDLSRVREEAIQVAAVMVAMIEDIDRQSREGDHEWVTLPRGS